MGVRRIIFLRALACGLVAFLLAGCAGYTLGPTNGSAAGEKTIQITPFANQTLEPHLGDALTGELRRQIQHDGTYHLATREEGDIIVSAVIKNYIRHEMSFAPNDTITPRDFRIVLTAQLRAVERSSGKVVLDKPVSGSTLIRVGTDLTSSERQGLTLLAADWAKHATAQLVDGSW